MPAFHNLCPSFRREMTAKLVFHEFAFLVKIACLREAVGRVCDCGDVHRDDGRPRGAEHFLSAGAGSFGHRGRGGVSEIRHKPYFSLSLVCGRAGHAQQSRSGAITVADLAQVVALEINVMGTQEGC